MARSIQLELFALVSTVLISGSLGANILGVFTSLSPSHLIIHMSVAKVLAENGHNVTVVTALKPKVNHKNINVLQIELSAEDQRNMDSAIGKMAKEDNSNMLVSVWRSMGQMQFMFDKMTDIMMDRRVTDLYENKDNKFDLVIVGFFMNDYQIGIAHKLKVPVIMSASMPPNVLFDSILGNPDPVAYAPAMGITVPTGQAMTFGQRLKNFATNVGFKVFTWVMGRKNANTYNKLYGNDPNMPSYSDCLKNVSLVFFGSHGPSEGPIRANVPASIEVGGIQVKDKPEPLPKNIGDFIDSAKDGAILLSLGSNVKSDHVNPEISQRIYNVLSKLKTKVIWKWENLDETPGKSDNILYVKWLPQDDILAHPNLKLFITHAGKGGITEASYHGKPMLALPVFGDQPSNADKMVKEGYGLTLSLLTLEEQPFHEAVTEVLNNPKYANKVKAFSALYRDRPMTARQSVLYWTEYVLRHHGAPHLQSGMVHLNFIAANNLDIYGLILQILFAFVLISKFVITFIYRKLTATPKKAKKVKKH